jgi:transposase InsO family protein
MQVSRSVYYKWRSKKPGEHAKRRKKLMGLIRYHFNGFKQRYGSPKVAAKLREEGWKVATKTVARLMKMMGLRSRTMKKYKATTNSKHTLPVFDNVLNRKFTVSEPNKVWVADITYIATGEGWVYLASLMDLFSRKIVGWAAGDRMSKELVQDALDDAYEQRRPKEGVIHHSDRGSQYASGDYKKLLEKYKMIGSMSRKGNCYDNACIESFHSVLKKELVYRKQAYDALREYIDIEYNRIRIHSTIGYLSPHKFEKRFFEQLQTS